MLSPKSTEKENYKKKNLYRVNIYSNVHHVQSDPFTPIYPYMAVKVLSHLIVLVDTYM